VYSSRLASLSGAAPSNFRAFKGANRGLIPLNIRC